MKFSFQTGDQPLAGYTIERAIHRGGFGEVYFARSDAGKEVALKLLHNNMEVELRGVQQCLNLKHPHLVTLFDVRQDADDDYWIVMEFIAGDTLAETIRQHPEGMPLDMVSSFVSQIAQGIDFLHQHGLVHRDLKPANIFCDDDLIKVGDVGLSKFISQSHHSAHTQSVGTVYYMAPEVARGHYGKEVDVYALGIIIYEMLTGRVPFDGQSTGEILMKHLTEQPDLSTIPAPLAEVIHETLTKDYQERISSAIEVNTRFKQALQKLDAADGSFGIPSQATTKSNQHSNGNSEPKRSRTENPRTHEPRTRPINRPLPQAGVAVTTAPGTNYFWFYAIGGAFLLLFMMRAGVTRGVGLGSLIFLGAIGTAAYFSWKKFFQTTDDLSAQPSTHRSANKRYASVSRPVRSQVIPRLSDMMLSLSLTPICVGLMSVAIMFLSQDFFASADPRHQYGMDWAHLMFFSSSAIIAVWSLMIAGFCFRYLDLDRSMRNLVLVALGTFVGAGIFGLNELLIVNFPVVQIPPDTSMFTHLGKHEMITQYPNSNSGLIRLVAEGSWTPSLAGYISFFALLFLCRSWWKLSDPTRDRRFQIRSVLLSAFVAYLICLFITFPLPWALTWSATMAATLQIVSPFQESHHRNWC